MTLCIRLYIVVLVMFVAGCAKNPGLNDSCSVLRDSGAYAEGEGSEADYDPDIDIREEVPAQEILPADARLTAEEEKILDTEISLSVDLDKEENVDVQRYFYVYTHDRRDVFETWLKRGARYLPHIRKRLREEGLPEDLAYLPFAESGCNPFAYSRSGAAGIWQFMPRTGRYFGLRVDSWEDERRDPYKSTEAAITYLKKLYGCFGDWALSLAAYNAGEGRIGREMEKTGCEDYFSLCAVSTSLHQETKLYVPKFMAIVKIARNLEKLGFAPIDWTVRPEPVAAVKVQPRTDLLALAKRTGMDWQTFREFNPALCRQDAPASRSLTLRVPVTAQAQAVAFAKNPIFIKKSAYYTKKRTYKVRAGDSWWAIAKKHGLSVGRLRKANRIKHLRPGQRITIPGQGAPYQGHSGTYMVRAGDTWWGIARKNGVSVAALQDMNRVRNLKPGQKITVPGAPRTVKKAQGMYTVQKGDTWWGIAKVHGLKVAELRSHNGQKVLQPGQKISLAAGNALPKTRQWAAKRANYVVRKGDTLWSLAKKFKTDTQTLLTANGLKGSSSLQIGQKLFIPDAGLAKTKIAQAKTNAARKELVHYQIRQGDSLWSIARQFGVSLGDLRSWNNLAKNSVLKPGKKLKVYR